MFLSASSSLFWFLYSPSLCLHPPPLAFPLLSLSPRRLPGVLLMAVVINSYLLSVHISPYIPLSTLLSIYLPSYHFPFSAISFSLPSSLRLNLFPLPPQTLPLCIAILCLCNPNPPSILCLFFFIVKRQKAQKGFLIKAGCC